MSDLEEHRQLPHQQDEVCTKENIPPQSSTHLPKRFGDFLDQIRVGLSQTSIENYRNKDPDILNSSNPQMEVAACSNTWESNSRDCGNYDSPGTDPMVGSFEIENQFLNNQDSDHFDGDCFSCSELDDSVMDQEGEEYPMEQWQNVLLSGRFFIRKRTMSEESDLPVGEVSLLQQCIETRRKRLKSSVATYESD